MPKDTDHKCLHQQFIKYRKKSNVGTSKNTDKGEREKNNFKAFYATQKCKNAINLISNRLVLVNDEEIAKTLDKYFCNIAKRL